MATAALEIHFQAGLGGASIRTAYLFEDRAAATSVFEELKTAVAAYNNRANDRERTFAFDCLTGRSAVDVTMIVAFGVDDPLGEHRAAVEEWNEGIGQIRKLAAEVSA